MISLSWHAGMFSTYRTGGFFLEPTSNTLFAELGLRVGFGGRTAWFKYHAYIHACVRVPLTDIHVHIRDI